MLAELRLPQAYSPDPTHSSLPSRRITLYSLACIHKHLLARAIIHTRDANIIMNRTQSHNAHVGPPPPEAAKAETRLKGHIGHLTPAEQSAFEDFKKLCAKEGYYTPQTANGKASHDDGTLV